MWLCNGSLFLLVYISWRFGGKCRCGVRLLHRCSLHWVWVTALWSLTRPTILCITTATGTPSWSQESTSWPQCWPLWLSLWSSVSEPRTLLWIVLQGKWESVHFIFDLSPSFMKLLWKGHTSLFKGLWLSNYYIFMNIYIYIYNSCRSNIINVLTVNFNLIHPCWIKVLIS